MLNIIGCDNIWMPKFYVKHQIEQVKTWACMKDSVAMQWYEGEFAAFQSSINTRTLFASVIVI